MKLTADQIAAIEERLDGTEKLLVVYEDPLGNWIAMATSATLMVNPDESLGEFLEYAAPEADDDIGGGKKAGAALVNLANGLIQRNEERYPKLFNPQEGDPHG